MMKKLKKGLVFLGVLLLILTVTACDNGDFIGDNGDEELDQDPEFTVVVEGLDFESFNIENLSIMVDGELFDELEEYYDDDKIEFQKELPDWSEISIAYDDEKIGFVSDYYEDDKTIVFNPGELADNIKTFTDIIENGELNRIILTGDINTEDVDEKVFHLNPDRKLIIEGQGDYGFKGDGSLRIGENSSHENDLIFKELKIEVGQPVYRYEENHQSRDYIFISGNDIDIIFNNIEFVFDDEIEIDEFIIAFLNNGSELIIENSNFDFESVSELGTLIDINNGGTANLLNNYFNGETQWQLLKGLNNPLKLEMNIEGNNFKNVSGKLLELQSKWGDKDLIVNDNKLEKINDIENEEEVQVYKEQAFNIHNHLAEINQVADNYITAYLYGDNDENETGYFEYKGLQAASVVGHMEVIDENEEGEYFAVPALVIMYNNGEEVKREYIDYNEEIDQARFEFEELMPGEYSIEIYNPEFENKEITFEIENYGMKDLGQIILTRKEIERYMELFLYLDNNEEYLDDKNVRKALASAINREKIAEEVDSEFEDIDVSPAKRILSPSRVGYEEIDMAIDYNIDNAKSYLENSDYDIPVEVDIINNKENNLRGEHVREIADYINNIDDFGIELNSKSLPWEDFIPLQSISSIGVTGNSPFMLDLLLNTSGLQDKLIDDKTASELLKKAQLNLDDLEQAMEYLNLIEEMLIEEAYYIPISYSPVTE